MFRKLWILLQFITVSAVMGALVGALFLPAVFGLNQGVQTGNRIWTEELPQSLTLKPLLQKSTMKDSQGNTIAEFYSENRVIVPSKKISPNIKEAIVAIEDERFYEHGPIDVKGTLRALISNTASDTVQGGSTITQQYVKNILFNNATNEQERIEATEQTVARKIRELQYALGLEEKMSKDEILTGYLNIVNFGDGAYGIESAAQHYFSVPATKLTIPQAAMIAGIVQNPSALNPVENPEDAKSKRNLVLSAMAKNDYITQAEYTKYSEQPLNLKLSETPNGCMYSPYPFYCQKAINEFRLNKHYGKTPEQREELLHSGITITTALEPNVQRTITKTAQKALGKDNQYAAGIAVVEPGTGKVKGIGTNKEFGSKDHQTQVILPTESYQIGSTFKPITLATALERGWSINDTLSSPAHWCATEPNDGCFSNLGNVNYGPINGKKALAYSANTYFTALSQKYGTRNVQRTAEKLGMDLPDDLTGHETSTTLGVFDASPLEVANIYATIAADGKHCSPQWITKVVNAKNKTVTAPTEQCTQALKKSTAKALQEGLQGVIDGPYPGRTGASMSLGRPAMGKTGTTDNKSSVWFAGAVPQYAMSVWIGDPRGGFEHPIENLQLYGSTVDSAFGSTGAGPIWKNSFKEILKNKPERDF